MEPNEKIMYEILKKVIALLEDSVIYQSIVLDRRRLYFRFRRYCNYFSFLFLTSLLSSLLVIQGRRVFCKWKAKL